MFTNTQTTTTHQFTPTQVITAKAVVRQQEHVVQDVVHPPVLVPLLQAVAHINTVISIQTDQNTTTQDTTIQTADRQQGHAQQGVVTTMVTVLHPCLIVTTHMLITTLTLPNIITTTILLLRLSLLVELLPVLLLVVLSGLSLSLD